ncbi:hypothetical protein GCM10023219_16800 [Stakelama sediminis]|uniref:Uncharacterized protein n=1 Tax=Stakelama sediminis TaxID=463200 RepID=A0A840YXZ7_9SPHN|nr:hypothetical protein [Stakelama sediminis]MBB5718409.1 hypothetical protein [Stakelama sediminis]
MSYDLVVFDPDVAPRERGAFNAWFAAQLEWAEDRDYSDPAGTHANLLRFYQEMRKHYPAMNGPDATQDDDEIDRSADYCIGMSFIYATFPWSLAEDIYPVFRNLSVECGVGFYDVSGDEGDGEIHFPGDALRPPSRGAWRDVAAQFRDLQNGQ